MLQWWEHNLQQMESHLIPCPFKVLTGCDCPACGLQRSAVQLFRGDVVGSFMMHPALLEALVLIAVWWLLNRSSFSHAAIVRKVGLWIVLFSTLVFYLIKMSAGHCCT
jgi:hypothetical protein